MEKTNFTFVFPSNWMKAFGLMLLSICWMGMHTASAQCEGELVCGGTLNTNLQDGCEATLTAASAVPGFDCAVTVVVEDGVGADNVIQGCGTYKYVVTDNADPNNSCWGWITAEDKIAPVLEFCPGTVTGRTVTNDGGYADFVCTDVDALLFSSPVTYKLDKNGNLIAGSFSSYQAEYVLKNITGFAEFTDNCGDITVTVTDVVDPGYDPDCDETTIYRRFTARDACKGLLSADVCEQKITIRKPNLKDVYCPKDAAIDCEDAADADFKLDANGNPHPDETGYPFVWSAFHPDLDWTDADTYKYEDKAGRRYLDPKYCNLGASYTDGERIVVCEGTYKIVRTWEILDWCSRKIYECVQIIKVGDSEAPEIACVK